MRDERKKREDGRRRKGNCRKRGEMERKEGSLGLCWRKRRCEGKRRGSCGTCPGVRKGDAGTIGPKGSRGRRGEAQNVVEKGEGVGGCGKIPFFQSAEAFAAQSRGGEKLTLVFSPSAGIVSLHRRGKRRGIRGNTMRRRQGSAVRDGVTRNPAFGLLIGFRLR